MDPKQNVGFISGTPKVKKQSGCCHSKHTKNCCIATSVFGALFLILGVIVLLLGKGMLEKTIYKSMALTPGSDRLASWLNPPVQAYMEAYGFDVQNPEEILNGKKPVVVERGPYVYKSDTIKDSDDNMQWHDSDGTLTYRPRKVYRFLPDKSCKTCNPDKDYMTFPNIPYWTGINGAQRAGGFKKGIVLGYVTGTGLNTPFVNVTLSELLWGYDTDELPCLKIKDTKPAHCSPEEINPFGGDDFDDDFRKKRDTFWNEEEEDSVDKYEIPQNSEWEKQVKPKMEYVNCSCNWGLFRDRNITMRKPVRFYTGQLDNLDMKGWVTHYNGKKELNWWQKGSTCDKVKGQDASTLPPGLNSSSQLEVFIALMCRTLKLDFEKEVKHAGIRTLRFLPPDNLLGSHKDHNITQRNAENECYCLEDDGFSCFKSGVMNLENCKRVVDEGGEITYPPLVLSQPHFYNADQSFRDAVRGLNPQKEKHEFYMDIVPEFGFPLAIMPRFQLNLVLRRENDVDALKNMEAEVVLPFLWAGLGFKEPSEEMAEQIRFGLDAPNKLPLLGAVVFFVLGGALLLTALGYFLWRRRSSTTADILQNVPT